MRETMMETPLFVTGASRSGTSLMQSILNRNTCYLIVGETHYFDDLRTRQADPTAPVSDEARAGIEDYFLSLNDRIYGFEGDPEKSSTQRETLRKRAQACGDSADAYLAAHCELEAEQAEKPRWGEKTPRHVFRIDQILDAFPTAKLMYMLRDPRRGH